MVDLAPLGNGVRRARHARGWTIAELADRAALSVRFVSDLERGRGNISIARLVVVARALEVPVSRLVAALDHLEGVGQSLSLVGLRGAGKSTIGRAVAARLKREFVELDQLIEAAAGLPLSQIFEMHGEAYYRRVERDVLARTLAQDRLAIVAVGGGVVTDPQSWALLRTHSRTVWLKAKPEEHYKRVMAQGDLRPMHNRPAAMAELRALLAARSRYYAEADVTVDTSGQEPNTTVDAVVKAVG